MAGLLWVSTEGLTNIWVSAGCAAERDLDGGAYREKIWRMRRQEVGQYDGARVFAGLGVPLAIRLRRRGLLYDIRAMEAVLSQECPIFIRDARLDFVGLEGGHAEIRRGEQRGIVARRLSRGRFFQNGGGRWASRS